MNFHFLRFDTLFGVLVVLWLYGFFSILPLRFTTQNQLTKFNRRARGYLDKKRLSGLGYGEESIFYRLRIAKFAPVHVHLTLDASSSMRGEAWQQALMVGVAVAYASSKIDNLDVTLSMRAGANGYATIAIIYDSSKDNVSKIKKLFPYLQSTGITPEGLSFAAIMDILTENKIHDKYFINISDGEPYYPPYQGVVAQRHTREQVRRIKAEGINVLSYFVSETGNVCPKKKGAFKTMYGRDASFIDVNRIANLINTLNKLFLQK